MLTNFKLYHCRRAAFVAQAPCPAVSLPMFLMYVDESGDSGLDNSPSRFFILTGLVVHELRWHDALDALIGFRQRMRSKFGLKLREEIHAGRMLNHPGPLLRIRKNDRLTIIRHHLDMLASLEYLNVINVRIDKQGESGSESY